MEQGLGSSCGLDVLSRDSPTMSNQGENLPCHSFSLSSVLRSLDGLASKFAEGAFLFDHIQLKIFAIDSK